MIVVDNGSADETLAHLRQLRPDAKIIENRKNIGFGRACNLAAQSAGGEYLLFLNPDAVLDPLSLDHLVEAHRSRSRVGFVVPRLRFPDGVFQPSCRQLPTINNMIFSRGSVMARFLDRLLPVESRYTLPDFDKVTAVPAIAGTVALIRRDLFLAVKGFDPRFFLYVEDTDLCARLGQSGYEHLYVPLAGAMHQWGRGSAAGQFTRIFRHHMSMWKYFLKHFPNGFSVILLPILLLVNAVVSLFFLPPRRAARP